MPSNTRRIAKNAIFLYVRMFITMIVSLFTSRVILNTLGETNFGIYNIVGGIVVLFSFLNAALTTATQRFFSYELGKKDFNSLKKIFSISMTCYFILAGIIIILSESIGLWILNTQLNIPEERMYAANWVYQLSIITFICQMLRIPYHASVIAYEKMNFFALISIVEVLLKLGIVYFLLLFTTDKLILYSILVFIVTCLTTIVYKLYNNKNFSTSKYFFYWDKYKFKDFLSFSGWSLFGSIANISSQQCINILLNIFYGVAVNAAVGIANQVTSAIYSFVSSFQTAFNPQITKTYADNQLQETQKLMFMACKLSFYLLLAIGLPAIINIEFILKIWLGNVPLYTAEFIEIIFVYQIIDAISMPFLTTIQARGNIKSYQITIGLLILINIPLAYIALRIGLDPFSVWFTKIIINVICFVYRCYYINKYIGLNMRFFFKEIILKFLYSITIIIPISIFVKNYITEEIFSIITSVLSSFFLTILCFVFIGLNQHERLLIKNYIFKHRK